jgi:spore coat protein U-like protein
MSRTAAVKLRRRASQRLRRSFQGCWMAAFLVAAPAAARAADCTATSTPLNFGDYNPFDSTPTAITATISVTCIATQTATISYKIALGPGGSGNFMRRILRNGGASLNYQLYTSAALDQIWGDGTGNTGQVSDSYVLSARRSQTISYRLYGSIPPAQNVIAGSYTDPILVILQR